MAEFKIVVGDTRRPVVANLKEETDDAGTQSPIDLTGCTVLFRMVNSRINADGIYEVKINDQPATIVEAAAGKVMYEWQPANVNQKGIYHAWFIVVQGGAREHLPYEYAFQVHINPNDGTSVDESLVEE